MRAKTRRLKRRAKRESEVGAPSTAEWLLESEVGWGMPHWIVAVPGLVFLAIQAFWATVAWWRRSRGPRGPQAT